MCDYEVREFSAKSAIEVGVRILDYKTHHVECNFCGEWWLGSSQEVWWICPRCGCNIPGDKETNELLNELLNEAIKKNVEFVGDIDNWWLQCPECEGQWELTDRFDNGNWVCPYPHPRYK